MFHTILGPIGITLLWLLSACPSMGQDSNELPWAGHPGRSASFLELIDGVAPRSLQRSQRPISAMESSTIQKKSTNQECEQAIWEADALVAAIRNRLSESRAPYPTRQANSISDVDPRIDAFKKQMTTLLSITLDSPDIDEDTKDRAIEAALNMMAEYTRVSTPPKSIRLTPEHDQIINDLQSDITRLTPRNLFRSDVVQAQYQQRINRMDEQRLQDEKIAFEKEARWELAAYQEMRLREAKRLKVELDKLNHQIESLLRAPSTPASKLNPLYSPGRRLTPITDQLLEPMTDQLLEPATDQLLEPATDWLLEPMTDHRLQPLSRQPNAPRTFPSMR